MMRGELLRSRAFASMASDEGRRQTGWLVSSLLRGELANGELSFLLSINTRRAAPTPLTPLAEFE
jgi:hypothetical protein